MSNHADGIVADNARQSAFYAENDPSIPAGPDLNADIYGYLDNGGSVQDDIEGMSLDEMEDYFQDLDPAEFL